MDNATIDVRIAKKQAAATDICTFELVAASGAPLPAFAAGSHVDVHLPNGLTRQYSLCNDPSESHRYLLAVLNDPESRGGSRAMHDLLSEGDTLKISGPKNHFALAHDATTHLLLAGGIGITPILCMAERLAIVGADFEMHYSARSVDRMAFRERIAASTFAGRVALHVDDGDAAQTLDLAATLAAPADGAHLYVCGPKGFMDAVLGHARAAGWPESRLHVEFFNAAIAKSDDDGSFDVKLASSGKVVHVAKDETIIEALAAAGIEVPFSCEQGVCGTCLTRVLDGIPDHRDLYLMPDEQAKNDQFTPCCSRSKSKVLLLDL